MLTRQVGLVALAVFSLLGLERVVFADSECNELLRQGIYNHQRERSSASREAQMRDAICTTYSEYKRDVEGGNVRASYALFEAEASVSGEQVKALGQTMCSDKSSDESARSLLEKASELVNEPSLRAFNECRALEANLRVKTEFREDLEVGGIGFIGLSVSYTPGLGVSDRPFIQSISISPPGAFTCTGPLWDTVKPSRFAEASLSMDCTRVVNREASSVLAGAGARSVHARSATITVNTGAGPVRRSVVAITPPPRPEPTSDPIGAVVAYSGNLGPNDVAPTGWMLCDGSPVSSKRLPALFQVLGTRYGKGEDPAGSKVGDFNLPDYRGYFLRGLDRSGSVDVDQAGRSADKEVGSSQADAVGKHVHPLRYAGNPIGQGDAAHQVAPGYSPGPNFGYIQHAGLEVLENSGSETRPKNVAVNYLIRVE